MHMTDLEIRDSMRKAGNPYRQVSILADLNGVSVETMKNKLTELGIMPKRPYHKMINEIAPETEKHIIEVIPKEDEPTSEVKTSDPVNRPSHYTDGNIEVIEYIEDKKLGFCLGNAVKYISRAGKKDPTKETEDLNKAIWYINRRIKELKEATV